MSDRRKYKQFIDRSESPTPHHFFLIFLLYTEREDRKNGEGERPDRRKKLEDITLSTNHYQLSTKKDCAVYRDNKFKAGLKKIALLLIIPENRVVRDAVSWGIVLGIMVWFGVWGCVKAQNKNTHAEPRGSRSLDFIDSFFSASSRPRVKMIFLHSSLHRFTASVLSVAVLFTFTQCGTATSGQGQGEAPWFLIASGVNNRTPSVSSGGSSAIGAQGGTGIFSMPVIPVAGLFFIHPDHLGSTTMITDGYGNPVSGGEYGGKSHISYKPYGEILRTDSGGPDITKFKYTGQIEDKETGLMYYKARYYDPMLARFT
jgi:hypothetical protein